MPSRLTTAEFIAKATTIHGDTYDYSDAVYTNSHTDVVIKCKQHGAFAQRPNNHLNGAGCSLCGYVRMTDKSKITKETFLARCKEKHNGTFDYSEVVFVDMTTPVKITHNCGYSFYTTPASHLTTTTCVQCSINKLIIRNKEVNKTAKNNFYSKYKDTYKFITPYTKAKLPITVQHLTCGHIFTSSPDNLKIERCPSCAGHGFNPAIPAILYYLSIDNGTYYKIGITNRTVKERFTSADLQKITIIHEWNFDVGQVAYNKEQELLKLFSCYKANTTGILSSGNSEIFTLNILQLGLLHENYFTDRT